MIKDIVLVNANTINFIINGKEDLDKFTQIFTVLDKHTVAKTITTNEIKVNYSHNGTENIVIFTSTRDFTYREIEDILLHVQSHDLSVDSKIIFQLLTLASQMLPANNIIFCKSKNIINCNFRTENNQIILHPMSEECLNYFNSNSQLISLMKQQNTLYTTTLNKHSIKIFGYSNIYTAIDSIIDILFQLKIIDDTDENILKNKLISLAFKDFANNELTIIDKIANYPAHHPLNKFKGAANNTYNILVNLIKDSLDKNGVKKLQEALNNEGEFISMPQIITRSFGQLKKKFPQELDKIINKENK